MAVIRLTILLTVLALTAGPARAQVPLGNMDFEAGPEGKPPPEWTVSGAVVAMPATAGTGRLAAHLAAPRAVLSRMVDAAPYRGHLLMLEAAIRNEDKAEAHLYLRTQAGLLPLSVTETASAGETWKVHRLILAVPAGADRIGLGVYVNSGTAWVDDVRLHTVTPAQVGFDRARPLTQRGLDNVAAFTRLLGYVRFFHPSDQAATADWNSFAIAGVAKVEGARNAGELAATLQAIFNPLAPTMRVAAGTAPAAGMPACAAGCFWVGWTHHGVGLDPANPVYHSEREARDRASPYLAQLGSGVSASIPLTLPRDAFGTVPQTAAPPPDLGKPLLFVPHGDDRSTRLADIALAWTVFQHFYPYFDVAKTDWDDELAKALRQAAIDTDAAAFEQTLQRLVAALHDGHGDVTDNRPSYRLPLGWDMVEGKLAVTRIDAGAPPDLRPGDIILAINGRQTAELMAAVQPRVSAATPQWRDIRTLRLLLPHDATPMTLSVQRGGGAPFTATITPSPMGAAPPASRKNYSEIRPGIRYVDLARVTDAEAAAAMESLAQARAIIFDMRGYPTGAAIRLLPHMGTKILHSAYFEVPVITQPDRRDLVYDRTGSWALKPALPLFPGKLVFLTGGSAISAAESFMGVVENEKLGTIVGETTAGTNGNINPFSLPGGYRLTWTGLRVVKPDGTVHQGVGIHPDIAASPTLAGLAAGRDEVLEKGIETALRDVGDGP